MIILDKPEGMSSARAVAAVKRLLPKDPSRRRGTRIGHAGTLDPFATGVLLLLIGKATRQCESLMDQPKEYEATIRLGATTPTDDPESEPVPVAGAVPPARELIAAELAKLVGAIQQRPPAFSALKVSGRRAYDLARKGHDVQLALRTVQVYRIDLLRYDWPDVDIRVECGRGTYIRALARDVGEALGVGGHLVALRRMRIGPYNIKDAVTLDVLRAEGPEKFLRPV